MPVPEIGETCARGWRTQVHDAYLVQMTHILAHGQIW